MTLNCLSYILPEYQQGGEGVNYILKIIFSYKINCTKLTTRVESLFEKLMDLPENDLRETVGKVGIPSTYYTKIL